MGDLLMCHVNLVKCPIERHVLHASKTRRSGRPSADWKFPRTSQKECKTAGQPTFGKSYGKFWEIFGKIGEMKKPAHEERAGVGSAMMVDPSSRLSREVLAAQRAKCPEGEEVTIEDESVLIVVPEKLAHPSLNDPVVFISRLLDVLDVIQCVIRVLDPFVDDGNDRDQVGLEVTLTGTNTVTTDDPFLDVIRKADRLPGQRKFCGRCL
jgi:hypothetical protein